jgi:hypothetical protein
MYICGLEKVTSHDKMRLCPGMIGNYPCAFVAGKPSRRRIFDEATRVLVFYT